MPPDPPTNSRLRRSFPAPHLEIRSAVPALSICTVLYCTVVKSWTSICLGTEPMICPCPPREYQLHHGMRQYCHHHIWDGEGANHPRSGGPKGASLLGLLAKIKCSICSYQLNIWYAAHWAAHILNWFLELGCGKEACLVPATGCLGIALPPSVAHFPLGKKYSIDKRLTCFLFFVVFFFFAVFCCWGRQHLGSLWLTGVPRVSFVFRRASERSVT